MIIHREDLVEYMVRNKRPLSITSYDLEVFKQLIERVSKVADQPHSRYFKVMSQHL